MALQELVNGGRHLFPAGFIGDEVATAGKALELGDAAGIALGLEIFLVEIGRNDLVFLAADHEKRRVRTIKVDLA